MESKLPTSASPDTPGDARSAVTPPFGTSGSAGSPSATSSSGSRGRPWWRPRWWELLPEATLALGLLVFFIDEPDPALSAFKSPRAIVLMTAGAVVWVVGRVALARYTRRAIPRTALFMGGSAVALAAIVLPAYNDTKVVETFPGLAAPAVSTTPTTPAATTPLLAAPSPTECPVAVGCTSSRYGTFAPATPVLLRSGSFRGIDHRTSGTVNIYRNPNGGFVVGLENIDIQPGPDYDVYIVPGADRSNRSNAIKLDDLRGNKGTQFYEVPSGTDVGSGEWTVLVWCQTFGVPIANATPA